MKRKDKGMTERRRQQYAPEFKLSVVLESFQQSMTQAEVCHKFGISNSLLHLWRQEFQKKAVTIFLDQRNPVHRGRTQDYAPGTSPDELKRIIRTLEEENAILKKAMGLLGNSRRLRR